MIMTDISDILHITHLCDNSINVNNDYIILGNLLYFYFMNNIKLNLHKVHVLRISSRHVLVLDKKNDKQLLCLCVYCCCIDLSIPFICIKVNDI